MFKRFLSASLSLFLVVGLVACGGGTSSVSSNLKSQIQICTPITDYSSDTSIEQVDSIKFGANSDKPIEWVVLEKQGNKAFLLSKYPLIVASYSSEETGFSWDKSWCRHYLNDERINDIFSEEEKKVILTTDVNNSGYGNNTKDKLFLLSYDEYEKYLNKEKKRGTGAVEIAKCKYSSGGVTYWYLRSPSASNYIACVPLSGLGGSYNSDDFIEKFGAIRPALWVKY